MVVQPGGTGLSLNVSIGLIFLIMVAFAYAEVFHNAMLPSVTPADKAGQVSGLAFALGNFGGVSMMVFVLFAFALPGVQDGRSCLLNHSSVLIRVVTSTTASSDLAGIWLLLFILPVLLFTPDGRSSGVTWQQGASRSWRSGVDPAPID